MGTWTFVEHRSCYIRLCTTESPPAFVFPAAAYNAAIFVSIANIVLALALGWYVLSCSVDNCFTVFLPLFASAAPLGNWALYRVGLHIFSYAGAGLVLFHHSPYRRMHLLSFNSPSPWVFSQSPRLSYHSSLQMAVEMLSPPLLHLPFPSSTPSALTALSQLPTI